MSLLFPALSKEKDGIYQPLPPAWLQAVLVGGAIAVIIALTISRGGAWMSLSVPVGLALGLGLRSALEWRRNGPRGQALVRVAGGALVFHGAGPRGRAEVSLAHLAHLVVYGAAGHRIYRFMLHDGSWREVQPQWRAAAESLVIGFLQELLGDRIVVEAPQTAFAHARGDGPYFGQ
ncbi:hypothetical protein [Pelomonas cellulosilytica]|uniref:Uncharacterized protein n=1 Tax=Pelomonas cellulosilytica TaxID=2906762 RepID=A0ABS8XRD7_9BURK|nr:hypothetical protein [Pelomonas sp. P8]MCE4553161.1 hypothetical protein [Pelomonas sp. P8]